MTLPKPGQFLHLKVIARDEHSPGELPKPSLPVKMEVVPMLLQMNLPKELNFLFVAYKELYSRFPWRRGYEFRTVLDTGASKCLIRTSDALIALGRTLDLDRSKLPTDKFVLPNGKTLEGFRIWMWVQLAPAYRPVLIPFFSSDKLDTPIVISWPAIRALYPFVLAPNYLALCDRVRVSDNPSG